MADTDKPDIEARFPLMGPARRALAEVEAADELAKAMPAGIVRTRARSALVEARAALEKLHRVCNSAERFEAVEAATLGAIRQREGGVRRGRN